MMFEEDDRSNNQETENNDVFPLPPNPGLLPAHLLVDNGDDTRRTSSKRKSKKRSKSEKSGPTTSSGLAGLFRYATKFDVLIMAIGFISSAVNGASMPILSIVFGKMTNMFINVATHGFRPENDTLALEPFDTRISKTEFTAAMVHFSINYIYIAVIVFATVFVQTLCWEMASERQIFRLRKIFFSQVLRQDISWYDENEEGDLPHKLSDDLERVREGIGIKFSMLAQYLSAFVIGMGVGFHANYKLTTAMVAVAPLVIGVSATVAWALSSSAQREQLRYGVAGGIATEVLNCVRTVAAFGGENHEINRYYVALKEGMRVTLGKYVIISTSGGALFLITYGAFAFAFWYGAGLLSAGEATPGSIFTVFFSVMTGAFSIGNALPFVNSVSTAIGAASTIFGIVDRVPPIDSHSTSGRIPDKLVGSVEFKDVSFCYPTRPEVKVLRGLNINIEPGKSVALVGASGAGKSTVVGLLLRFYDPADGKVNIDGVSVGKYNLAWLRSQIGVVSQEPILFGVSIAENIRFGRDNVTETEIVQAATAANAHSFIKDLPKGYDTEVGDKGTMLSGGQKQRIAIARALIRDPKILLLDEATSALDSNSERIVQAALDKAMNGRTTIIVAHRLSTIKNVDVIYALKDGKVFEQGSHSELMEKKGLYFGLVEAQKKREISGQTSVEDIVDADGELIPRQRRKSSGVLSRNSLRNRSIKTSENVYVGAPQEETKEDLARKVNILKLLKRNLKYWWLMLLAVMGAVTVGTSMPLFSSLYADVFHTFTLKGEEFTSAVRYWTIVYLIFAVSAGLGNLILAAAASTLTEIMIVDIRQGAFTSVLKQTISWFDDEAHTPGRLVTALARDPPLIKAAAGFRAGQVLVAITSLVAAVFIAFIAGWKLASLLLFVAPIIAGAAYKQSSLLRRHQKRDAKFMDDAGQVANEAVYNLKTVQALGKEKLFVERYSNLLQLPYKEAKKQALVYAIVFAISQSVIYIMYAAAFRYGAKLIENQETTPTSVYRVFFALSFCATAVGQASTYFQDFAKAKLSLGFVYRLISLGCALDPLSSEGAKPEIKGKITLKDVHFSYPTRRQVPILKGLNLTIYPGQTVALVGGSGCGKSTLIGLIERFYFPTSGKIYIDDVDISTVNLKWLRTHIGLVTQEPTLFDCSIKENIAYGAKDRDKVTDEDIFTAARTANVHDFIVTLPQGYDTPVGDRGAKLSGGQKQRLAIARALIRNPKILLLDEATSALDTESEKVVQLALDKAREGRTSIVIAHRLSTVQNADVIVVINQGQVAEMGTHHELIANEGLYYELVKNQ